MVVILNARIYQYGEGDDDDDLEGDFEKWKAQLWSELKQKVLSLNTKQPESKEEIKIQPEETNQSLPFEILLAQQDLRGVDVFSDNHPGQSEKEYDFQASSYLGAKVIKITKAYELRQNNQEGSTVHIEFDLDGSGLSYLTAGNLYLYPENDPQLVDAVAKKIKIGLDQVFLLQENKPSSNQFKHPIPSPISVKDYLTHFCDLQGPVRYIQLCHQLYLT